MKRPSFQFYPSDWLRDTALRICSVGVRGLWIDMICFMHQGNPYGFLKVGNKVILPSNLASMSGSTLEQVEGWLDELLQAGVYDIADDGSICSRRMIRDENLRNIRAAGGKLGGNPKLLAGNKDKVKVSGKDKGKQTPSSSSASSSSSTQSIEDGFQKFWDAWPKSERKQDKSKCKAKWEKDGLDALVEQILSDVAVKKRTKKWGDGFIEAPLVYLNNRRWEDGVTPGEQNDTANDPDSRANVEAEGVRNGLGKWDERVEQWHIYKARVRGTGS